MFWINVLRMPCTKVFQRIMLSYIWGHELHSDIVHLFILPYLCRRHVILLFMATKTKTKTKTDEAPREHKKPWQETYATVEEMRSMRYQMAQGADGADGAQIF